MVHGSWARNAPDSRRSLVENAVYRYNVIIGRAMRSRTLQGQRVEATLGCRILNTIPMRRLGETERERSLRAIHSSKLDWN